MPDSAFLDKLKRIDPSWWGAAAAVAGAGAVVVPGHRVLAAAAGGGLVLWLAWSRTPCCDECAQAKQTDAAPERQVERAPVLSAPPISRIAIGEPSPAMMQAFRPEPKDPAPEMLEVANLYASPTVPAPLPPPLPTDMLRESSTAKTGGTTTDLAPSQMFRAA